MSRKKINLVLLTVAFLVWLLVFYKLIAGKNEDDNSSRSEKITAHIEINPSDSTTAYPADKENDPFITPYNYTSVRENNVHTVIQLAEVKHFPDLNLVGIIYDNKKAMAILGLPDNTVRFVQARQIIDNIEVLQIEKNKVVLKFGDQINSLFLE